MSPDIGIRTDITTGPNDDGIHNKTPDEVVVKQVEYSGLMDTGEVISSIDDVTITRDDGVSMGGSDLTKDSQSYSGTQVQLTLSAGVLGTGYNIVARVITDNGQTLDGKVRMVVRAA